MLACWRSIRLTSDTTEPVMIAYSEALWEDVLPHAQVPLGKRDLHPKIVDRIPEQPQAVAFRR